MIATSGQGPLQAVQTAAEASVVGSRQCEVCGTGLQGRQRPEAQVDRDDEIRALLQAALRKLEDP